MNDMARKINEATRYLQQKIDSTPRTAIIAGTGLSGAMEAFAAEQMVLFQDIPHFPVSTVESHLGRISFGMLSKNPVMIMQGRFHLYEGYTPLQVTFPLRVMQKLGIRSVIMTNAAGGICPSFRAGDIMAITDHINLTGENPLRGPNDDSLGVRFPDMSHAYSSQMIRLAEQRALKLGVKLQRGVYAGLGGPSLETPAEIRFLKTIGADAVGFSTVLETIAAVHGKMQVLGLSLITNVHDPDNPSPTTVEAVLECARNAQQSFGSLIKDIADQIGDGFY